MYKKVTAIILVCVLLISIAGCSSSARLEGSWAYEGSDEAAFTFYDDGTCDIAYEYGIGTWEITNSNELKIVNYYGEVQTATISEITSDTLVLTNGNSSVTFVKID